MTFGNILEDILGTESFLAFSYAQHISTQYSHLTTYNSKTVFVFPNSECSKKQKRTKLSWEVDLNYRIFMFMEAFCPTMKS